MRKDIILCLGLAWLCFAQQQCNTVQWWSVATDRASVYPYKAIFEYLDTYFGLTDITFTASGGAQYSIEEILVYPKLNTPIVTGDSNATFVFDNSYFLVNFIVQDVNNTVMARGTMLTGVAFITVLIYEAQPLVYWESEIVNVAVETNIKNLYLTDNTLYDQVLQVLNDPTKGIAAKIVADLKDPETANQLNSQMQNELQQTYSDTYTYKDDEGTILFDTQVLSSSFVNGTLKVQRILSIQGSDNQCETSMKEPSSTQGGKSVSQITAISLAQLNTTFNYAIKNGFFDRQLEDSYSSEAFQFNAGTLAHIIQGLNGFTVDTPVEGSCIVQAYKSQNTLIPQQDGSYAVDLFYTCQLYQPGSATNIAVSFSFNLVGSVKVSASTNQLIVLGQGFSFQNLAITYTDTHPKKNEDLAQGYLLSVIESSLNGKQLFGSGFPTLFRNGRVGSTLNQQDCIIYEYNHLSHN